MRTVAQLRGERRRLIKREGLILDRARADGNRPINAAEIDELDDIDRHIRALERQIRELRSRRPTSTAFHEAGHAVAGVAEGLRIESMGLTPGDSRRRGYVTFDRVPSTRVTAAGLAAERRAGYNPSRAVVDRSSDGEWIARGRADVHGEIGRAYGFVDRNWPAIEALARALQGHKRQRLSGPEAHRIIRAHTPRDRAESNALSTWARGGW